MDDVYRCIKETHKEHDAKTWCGKKAIGFVFVNIDHAAYNSFNEGRLLTCPQCVERITKLLNRGL